MQELRTIWSGIHFCQLEGTYREPEKEVSGLYEEKLQPKNTRGTHQSHQIEGKNQRILKQSWGLVKNSHLLKIRKRFDGARTND